MASFQDTIRTFLQNKLNDTTNNPLVASGTTFKLYNRYEIEEQDFFDFVVESVDWEDTNTGSENNVVIEYDGEEYNTQNGQYTLEKVAYIPGIIENFMAEFEPINFIRNVQYTIPVTFYINETINRSLDNKIIEAVEVFQDKIRGAVQLIYSHNVLLNHTDITPLTGIIDFNGTIFREYQIVIYMDAIKQVLPSNTAYAFFGNQIEYRITIPTVNSGTKFRIHPLTAMAVRSNELHVFQKFSTASNNEYDVKAIPNESGFSLELAFFYTGDSFTKYLYQQKYAQTDLPIIKLEIKYPAQPGDTQIPMERDYLIESIGGTESVGDKIIFSVSLRPVSEVYS